MNHTTPGARWVLYLALATCGSAALAQDDVRRHDRVSPGDRPEQSVEWLLPALLAGGPLGEQPIGGPSVSVVGVERSDLDVRNEQAGLQFRRLLWPNWQLFGAYGVSRSHLRQQQSETSRLNDGNPMPALSTIVSQTEAQARSQGLTLGLTWWPGSNGFVDMAVGYSQGRMSAQRQADGRALPYAGSTASTNQSFAVDGGVVMRLGSAWAWVPQAGVQLVKNEVRLLQTRRYSVGPQQQEESSARLALQLQRLWMTDAGWRITPYAGLAWRQRISMKADAVTLFAPVDPTPGPGVTPRFDSERRQADPKELAPKRTSRVSLGATLRSAQGVGLFAEWAQERATLGLKGSRVALGIHFTD
jgi:Autotransporter beta-domain